MLFIHTSLMFLFFQSVNRLTLYPLNCNSRKLFSSSAMGRSRYTTCDMSKVGSRSRVILVTTPRAPKPTTAPGKISGSFCLDRVTNWPEASTNSMADTEEDKLLFFIPEPWVAVAHAPTTVIWGREARLGKA